MKPLFEPLESEKDISYPTSAQRLKIIFFTWIKRSNIEHWLPLITIAICIVMIIAIAVFIHRQTTEDIRSQHAVHDSQVFAGRLNDIQGELQQMSHTLPNSPEFKASLQQLTADVAGIDKAMTEVAKSADVKQVAAQLTGIKEDINSLQKSMMSNFDVQTYADPKLLPFRVTAIDVISGQPFATVQYETHIQPLGIGDAIASWQLVTVDYPSASAEFVNDQGQHIKVTAAGQ